MDKERCIHKVRDRDSTWPRFHQCKRKSIIQRDGKWYCKQHDPVEVKKRNDERDAKHQAKRDKEKGKWRRAGAMRNVCEGISTDELEKLSEGELAMLLAKEADNA